MKVMLRDPGTVKSAAFSVLNLFRRQPVALLRRGVVEQAGKKTDAFARHADSLISGRKTGMASINARV